LKQNFSKKKLCGHILKGIIKKIGMGNIDFIIPSILISSAENAMFHKYVFASSVYVLKVPCI